MNRKMIIWWILHFVDLTNICGSVLDPQFLDEFQLPTLTSLSKYMQVWRKCQKTNPTILITLFRGNYSTCILIFFTAPILKADILSLFGMVAGEFWLFFPFFVSLFFRNLPSFPQSILSLFFYIILSYLF